MIDRRALDKWIDELGFDPDIIERVYHMVELMNEMKKADLFEQRLALKGGTAINLFLLDLPRLSVDIDLNYIGDIGKANMQKARRNIEVSLKELGNPLGYEVIDKGSSYIISRSMFKYVRSSGLKDHVKVEINFLERMPLCPIVRRSMGPSLPFFRGIEVPTYDLFEICAQKAVACIQRRLPKDIFDMYELGELVSDTGSIQRLAVIYHCMHTYEPPIDLSFFDRMDMKRLRQALGPFLRKDVDYKRMVGAAKEFASRIFDLDADSIEFLRRFFEDGEIIDDFLGSNIHLKDNPALVHRSGKRS